jgi:hypothetical protein
MRAAGLAVRSALWPPFPPSSHPPPALPPALPTPPRPAHPAVTRMLVISRTALEEIGVKFPNQMRIVMDNLMQDAEEVGNIYNLRF